MNAQFESVFMCLCIISYVFVNTPNIKPSEVAEIRGLFLRALGLC